MPKSFYIFVICALSLFFACSKDKGKATNYSKHKAADSVLIYLSYANQQSISHDKRLQFARKGLDILQRKRDGEINRQNLSKLALTFFSLQSWDDFDNTSNLILKTAINKKDTFNIAKAYRYKAEYFKNIRLNDSSYYFYLKAEKLYEKLGDKNNLGKILLSKGIIQYYENDYFGAELSISKAYILLDETKEKQLVYEALSMIGIIANDLKDYSKAIEYHQKAFSWAKNYNLNDELNQEATSLNNIGNVYQNLNQNKEAVYYFSKALENKKNLVNDFPGLYAMLLDNLAYSQFKLGNYRDLPQLFEKSLQIRDSLRFTSGIIYSKIHLSEYYGAIKDTGTAIKLSIDAFETAKSSKLPTDILASLKQVSTVDSKNASLYSQEYIAITDSLQQAERRSKDKFARIHFETDELALQKDKLEEKNRNLLLFFVATVMIGLLLFVIRTQRTKNRELLHKQAQQKANEDIYNLMLSQQNKIEEGRIKEKKRIAQELHDGVLGRLFGARLNLDSLNKMEGGDAEEKRNNYLSELKNIEQDIREISHDLNREKFVLINNFVAILNNLLEEQRSLFDAEVVSSVDDKIQWESVNNALKINLYRIVQEALQNINKYAKASLITVSLKKEGPNLTLSITDDGVGFAVDKKSKGIGLQNMGSRVNECEGIFDIKSKKGKGTTITIEFPIESNPVTA